MDIFEITMRLNGNVQPVGDSAIDSIRYENLRNLILLTDKCLGEIHRVAADHRAQEASRSKAGKLARKFLSDVALAADEQEREGEDKA